MNFTFGLEIELLIKPKPEPRLKKELAIFGWTNPSTPWETKKFALRRALASIFTEAGIPSGVFPEERDGKTVYDTWTIADEPALTEPQGFFGIEFISKVMETTLPWTMELQRVFQLIHTFCEVLLTPGCSTHIHMCPDMPGGFQPVHILNLIKAMAYFDDPITRVMPPERKDNEWAKSNMLPRRDAFSKQLSDAYMSVRSKTWSHIFKFCGKAIKTIEKKSIWKNLLATELFPDKYLAWNFLPLLSCGTVEFRRPPGVSNAIDASHWVAFSLGFISAALQLSLDSKKEEREIPLVGEVRDFIQQGADRLGPEIKRALRSERMVEDRRSPPYMTPEQLRDIKLQKEKYRQKKSPFAEKVASRRNSPASSRSSSSSSRRR